LVDSKDTIKGLSKQLEARNNEIRRLQGLYEGGQSLKKLAVKHTEDTNDQVISRLNGHIDFLNKENHRLEEELKKCDPQDRAAVLSLEGKLNSRIAQLTKKNETLTRKLTQQEKTIQQLDSDKTSLIEQLAFLKSTSEEKVIKEQQRTLSLSNQIKDLEGQINSTQKKIENSDYLKAAYASDKKAYAGAMEDLKNERVVLTRQNKELLEDIQRLKAQLEETRNEVNIYKGKYANASREVEMSRTNGERLKTEAHEQAEECISLRKQLHDLEAELLGTKNEKANLRFEIERQERQKTILEQQLDTLKGESLKKKSEMESSGATNIRLEALYNAAQAEIEYLKKDNTQLEQLLGQQKIKVNELDKKTKEYYMQISTNQDNMKILQNEQRLICEELLAKSSELRKVSAEKSQLELKVKDNKSLELQIEAMNTHLYKARQENLRLENEKGTFLAKISQLEADYELTKDQVNKLNERILLLITESEQYRNKVQELEEINLKLENEIERIRTTEQDLAIHKTALEKIQKQDSNIAKKLEEVQLRLKKTEIESEGNKRKAKIGAQRIEELEQELSMAREELMIAKMKLGNVERTISTNEEYKKDLLMQVNEMNENLLEERKEKELFESKSNDLKRELEASKARESALSQQVIQLKELIEQLDTNSKQLIQHIKSSTKDKEKDSLLEQIEVLKNENMKEKKELDETKDNLNKMHMTLDGLQNELDVKTEECEGTKSQIASLKKELEQLRLKTGQQLVNEDVFNKRILERENEVRTLKAKIAKLSKELEESRELLIQKDKENKGLIEDIQAISQENQYVNDELVKLNQSQRELKEITEGLQFKEQEAHKSLIAQEEERNDIMDSYKVVCDANERQKFELEALANENRNLDLKVQEMSELIKAHIVKIQRLEQGEQRYLAELKMQERQINQLVKELEDAQAIIREGDQARQAALNEAEYSHKVLFEIRG